MSDYYEDIIDLPHFVSPNRKPMSLHDRAAQFAPFKALTGYEEAIDETARLTDSRIELSEKRQKALNTFIHILSDCIKDKPEITVEYFVPDSEKEGGAYIKYCGNIRKIDLNTKQMIFTDGFIISLDDVYSIESPVFSNEI